MMLDIDKIIELYTKENMSIKNIAKELHCGKNKISQLLKDNNIQIGKSGIINFIDENEYKITLLKTGVSNTYTLQIASKIGINDFYNKIYNNASIYLDRKYDKFQRFFKILEEKNLSIN